MVQVAEEIRRDGGKAAALAGDVTADDFPARCVAAAVDKFGTIDILVNNAGANRSTEKSLAQLPRFTPRRCCCDLCSLHLRDKAARSV